MGESKGCWFPPFPSEFLFFLNRGYLDLNIENHMQAFNLKICPPDITRLFSLAGNYISFDLLAVVSIRIASWWKQEQTNFNMHSIILFQDVIRTVMELICLEINIDLIKIL